MMTPAELEWQIYLSAIVSYSFLLLSAFALLSIPALIAIWLLRRKPVWLRGITAALCIVAMSVAVPMMFLVVSEELTASNFQRAPEQSSGEVDR